MYILINENNQPYAFTIKNLDLYIEAKGTLKVDEEIAKDGQINRFPFKIEKIEINDSLVNNEQIISKRNEDEKIFKKKFKIGG